MGLSEKNLFPVFLSSTEPIFNSFLSLFCVCFIYMVLLMQDIFYKTFGDIFSIMYTLQRYHKWIPCSAE